MKVPEKIETWQMVRPWGKDEKGNPVSGIIERTSIPLPELNPGEVLVEIKGCGVCHTDLGYFFDGVPTVNKPPLTLGHEISGVVVAGDKEWIGKEVIIPAVMPCRKCFICKTGRGNRCLDQRMPGNSLGIYGGFSSHIPVPSIDLCEVRNRPADMPLERLAVIADAVSTPFQAAKRANLGPGDLVVVVGCGGGVGVYMTQIAKFVFNSEVVIGIDVDEEKLNRALKYGADFVINAKDKTPRDIREEWRKICRDNGLRTYGWKIFEVSGVKAGQQIALELLTFICKLIVVGYSPHTNEYQISRLMAFDAEMIGTWGCLPEYYPVVLDMVLKGKIQIDPFVELRPMSHIKEVFEEVHAKPPLKRIVLVPDF
mgnify:CR=1 FL=1